MVPRGVSYWSAKSFVLESGRWLAHYRSRECALNGTVTPRIESSWGPQRKPCVTCERFTGGKVKVPAVSEGMCWSWNLA